MAKIQHCLFVLCLVTRGSFAANSASPIRKRLATEQDDADGYLDVTEGLIDPTLKLSSSASSSSNPIRKRSASRKVAVDVTDGDVDSAPKLSAGSANRASPIRKRKASGQVAADGGIDMSGSHIDSSPMLFTPTIVHEDRKRDHVQINANGSFEMTQGKKTTMHEYDSLADSTPKLSEASPAATYEWGTITSPMYNVTTLTSALWPSDYCVDFTVTLPSSNTGYGYGYLGTIASLGQVCIVATQGIKLLKGTGVGFMAIQQSNGNGPYFVTEGLGSLGSTHHMSFCYKESTNEAAFLRNGRLVKADYLKGTRRGARYPDSRGVHLTLFSGYHTRSDTPLSGGKLTAFLIRPYQVQTSSPTEAPTEAPTSSPTSSPTDAPTDAPTQSPTSSPTDAPTDAPTYSPTYSPTVAPTDAPIDAPTQSPTSSPTSSPTDSPTATPTDNPTATPTGTPTAKPTAVPTATPTGTPTFTPTPSPTYPAKQKLTFKPGDLGLISDGGVVISVREDQAHKLGHLKGMRFTKFVFAYNQDFEPKWDTVYNLAKKGNASITVTFRKCTCKYSGGRPVECSKGEQKRPHFDAILCESKSHVCAHEQCCMPPPPLFKLTDGYGKSCSKIKDETTCKNASNALKLSWVMAENQEDLPSGCYAFDADEDGNYGNADVYFNEHPSGNKTNNKMYRPICQTTPALTSTPAPFSEYHTIILQPEDLNFGLIQTGQVTVISNKSLADRLGIKMNWFTSEIEIAYSEDLLALAKQTATKRHEYSGPGDRPSVEVTFEPPLAPTPPPTPPPCKTAGPPCHLPCDYHADMEAYCSKCNKCIDKNY